MTRSRRFVVPASLLLAATAFVGWNAMPSATGSGVADAAAAPVLAPTSASEPLEFTMDPSHCMALFRIHHVGAGQFWGRFNDVRGTVTYAEDDSSAPSFALTIPVESVDTGIEKLDRNLMGPNFFNRKEFETITYRSTSAERVAEKRWRVTGDLTMLGKKRSVVAEVEVTGIAGNPVQKKAGFEAILKLKRSDFGMEWGVSNGALGDEVRLVVGLEGDASL